jgi:hypothetical protein
MNNKNKNEKIRNDKDFIDVSNSLNRPNSQLNSEDIMEPHSYGYTGRIGRQVTVNVQPIRNNKFNKVIIPYSFEEKRYMINNKEIEFYNNRGYLLNTLRNFNSNDSFDIEKNFNPRFFQKLSLYVPFFLICFIVLYIAIAVTTLFSFNLVVIFTLVTWLIKGYNFLQMFKFILLEKFKIKEIHKILDDENESEFCVNNKLKWVLGQSGYWLEVQKLIE